MIRLLISISLIISACAPAGQSSVNSATNPKKLAFSDQIYEAPIRTVLLHPAFNTPDAILQPATTSLNEWNLLLEFDDLATQKDNFYAYLIHCNYDWTRSTLQDLDFLKDFNEFPILNFEYSADSHVPYIHYWLSVPRVKLPGNYLLVVYRGSDKSDIILSKRFMVFDRQISFQDERNLLGSGGSASRSQQLNFTLNYKNVEILNPLENLKVVVRQNQRWDNLAIDVKPSFVREIEKEIEYRFFDESKMFKGGNEFRFFDLRSLNNPGRNVGRVDRSVKPVEAYIQPDKPRTNEVYGQYLDLNGGFILDNFDYRDANFSNYAWINFTLSTKEPVAGKVYVTGAFNQWNLNQDNRMTYDTTRHEYHARIFLKQGWYDYQYVTVDPSLPYHHFEGSHFETENLYEIFVYYRPFQPRADLLIGYVKLQKNPR